MTKEDQLAEMKHLLTQLPVGPWKTDLDTYDSTGPQIEVEVGLFDEDISFLFTSGSGLAYHQDGPDAERHGAFEEAKTSLAANVAKFCALARLVIPDLLVETDDLKFRNNLYRNLILDVARHKDGKCDCDCGFNCDARVAKLINCLSNTATAEDTKHG